MPLVEQKNETDEEFINFIKDFDSVSKPAIMELLKKYNHKNIIIFKSREEADEYLRKFGE